MLISEFILTRVLSLGIRVLMRRCLTVALTRLGDWRNCRNFWSNDETDTRVFLWSYAFICMFPNRGSSCLGMLLFLINCFAIRVFNQALSAILMPWCSSPERGHRMHVDEGFLTPGWNITRTLTATILTPGTTCWPISEFVPRRFWRLFADHIQEVNLFLLLVLDSIRPFFAVYQSFGWVKDFSFDH